MRCIGSFLIGVAAIGVICGLPEVEARQADAAAAKVVPIQITGDDAARFTMVVLGDGYTAADMPKFRAELDKHLNILWSFEPFSSYRNYFNVYAVEVVSADSGLTCDPQLLEEPNMDPEMRKKLQQRNTVFGLNFGGGCTNVNARGVTPQQALQARVREFAARATREPDQILIIGNSRTYGGIGGRLATSTGSNALSPLITPHEIGHSLGRLGDEYTYSARGKAGGTYTGNEPASVHMTLLTEEEMTARQAKWFRWLGEPSEAGGLIGRYEGGSGNTKGIWRPSRHSIMISLGYFFDQVGREEMVRQISSRVGLIAAATPHETPVQRGDPIWINPAHPVHHELEITWKAGDRVIPNPKNLPYLDAAATAALPPGEQRVSVTVVDPTDFVRDPELRRTVLTATRTWTVTAAPGQRTGAKVLTGIGNSTQTQRAVGATDVVYVDAMTPKEDEQALLSNTTWRLDGVVAPDASGRLSFGLASRKLTPGTHRLSVTVGTPKPGAKPDPTIMRSWRIDNTMPTVAYTLSRPIASIGALGAMEPHVFMRDEFTMKLDPKDDQPGYVVAEFRVNGDGWHHYYGWPDAPPGTPFKFTARGTNIKELIYGSLSSEGLSPQPWEAREPGWGTHRIEYRAKDAAGNIGPAKAFRVSIVPALKCTETITGRRASAVDVESGVTCLDGATVTGPVTVKPGASLVATNSRVSGALTTTGASTIELVSTTVGGSVKIAGTKERLTIFGATFAQDVDVSDSQMTAAPLITGSAIKGALTCSGNSSAPVDGNSRNTVARGATGQCR